MPGNEDLYTQIAPGIWGLNVAIKGGSPADGAAAPSGSQMLFNETVWDRQRGNVEGVAFNSTARSGNYPTAVLTNYNARGIIVFLDIHSTTGGLYIIVQGYDPSWARTVNLNPNPTFATTNGSHGYLIYPGASGTPGVGMEQVTSAVLPRKFIIQVVAADAGVATYSVGYSLIV